jgi:hypothetical protein
MQASFFSGVIRQTPVIFLLSGVVMGQESFSAKVSQVVNASFGSVPRLGGALCPSAMDADIVAITTTRAEDAMNLLGCIGKAKSLSIVLVSTVLDTRTDWQRNVE